MTLALVVQFSKYAITNFLFMPLFFGSIQMLQAKPSLADQNVILVFVIGGINGVEVKFLDALISSTLYLLLSLFQ